MANQSPHQKHPGGRPTSMTSETLAKLRTAFMIGCTEEEACAFAEINEITLWRYKKRNPEYSKQIQAYQLKPILKAKMTVFNSLNKDKNAQWYLERKKKDEFSTKQIIEDVSKLEDEVDKLDKLASAISSLSQDVKSTTPKQS